jgi:hypothetical protein
MRHRLEALAQYLRGRMGYFGISQYYRPIPELDEWLRGRVHMGYWKQWLREERKAQLEVGARRVEGGRVMQLGERSRNDNPFHFSAARTRASASSMGIS